jgi:hypothetical protein
VKMGPKGGRSDPSPQRRLAAEGQLVVAAGTAVEAAGSRRCTRAQGRFGTVREGLERVVCGGSVMMSTMMFRATLER